MGGSNRRQQQDQRHLFNAFYSSFDQARSEAFLRDYQTLGLHAAHKTFLGEGRHARAYLSRSPGADGKPGQVVRLFRSEAWLAYSDGRRRLSLWWVALQKLATLRLPLIPPYALLSLESQLAMVAPYGEPYQEAVVAPHWRPLEAALTQLSDDLARHGLCIDDQMQVWVWQGIPFVSDLSDLKQL